MLIESFLVKIAASVIKSALASKLAAVVTAFEIFSVFDAVTDAAECVTATSDCDELGVCALEIASDPMVDAVVDRFLNEGETTFSIEQTKSGLYVASRLTPRFLAPQLIIPDHNRSTRLTNTKLVHQRLPHRLLK